MADFKWKEVYNSSCLWPCKYKPGPTKKQKQNKKVCASSRLYLTFCSILVTPHHAVLRGDKGELFIIRLFLACIFLFPWIHVLEGCDCVLTAWKCFPSPFIVNSFQISTQLSLPTVNPVFHAFMVEKPPVTISTLHCDFLSHILEKNRIIAEYYITTYKTEYNMECQQYLVVYKSWDITGCNKDLLHE